MLRYTTSKIHSSDYFSDAKFNSTEKQVEELVKCTWHNSFLFCFPGSKNENIGIKNKFTSDESTIERETRGKMYESFVIP